MLVVYINSQSYEIWGGWKSLDAIHTTKLEPIKFLAFFVGGLLALVSDLCKLEAMRKTPEIYLR